MWYIYERRKMKCLLFYTILAITHPVLSKTIVTTDQPTNDQIEDGFDNNIIDFDEDYSVKVNKKYGPIPHHTSDRFNKEANRYTIVKSTDNKDNKKVEEHTTKTPEDIVKETTEALDFSVIPLELLSTTENILYSIVDSTTEPDLTVIPLSTTKKSIPEIEIKQTILLPTTPNPESSTEYFTTTEYVDNATATSENNEATTKKREVAQQSEKATTTVSVLDITTDDDNKSTTEVSDVTETVYNATKQASVETKTEALNITNSTTTVKIDTINHNTTNVNPIKNRTVTLDDKSKKHNRTILIDELMKTNTTEKIETKHNIDFNKSDSSEEDNPLFTELDTEFLTDVPEDYYDSKDVVPTTAPKNDALSVIFGLAGSVVESVVESVAERVVPKGIYDLFKRMQKQNEALEAERLRSREENGGLGQFTRGLLKSITTGLSKPLSQLMAARDIGSLDTDRGFVSGVTAGVTSLSEAFKDRVQAIYPGTVWCGDGHSASARSSDLGLFFFTDTCCRQHDACKIFIAAGDTKYGLANTGLFTRSHCSCDTQFRECLRKTNSLVSAQIGLTYFNVLGPQCFRKAHPIIKCIRRTRITGQKCEEYELDYTKPKMWQWFDNETY